MNRREFIDLMKCSALAAAGAPAAILSYTPRGANKIVQRPVDIVKPDDMIPTQLFSEGHKKMRILMCPISGMEWRFTGFIRDMSITSEPTHQFGELLGRPVGHVIEMTVIPSGEITCTEHAKVTA